MRVGLDLLAESAGLFGNGGVRGIVVGDLGVEKVAVEVPGADYPVTAAGISMRGNELFSLCIATERRAVKTYKTELEVSTARPLTPNLCPPLSFGSGKTTDAYTSAQRSIQHALYCRGCNAVLP